MGFSTVLIISLAAGVILVVGGGLVMYMANLVKSAYELKVQINAEVEERLTKMGDDLDKKSRWIKRDLLEEIEKIKVAMQTDNQRKIGELADPLHHKLAEIETLLKAERAEWVKAVESDRQNITSLDTRLKAVRRDLKKVEDKVGVAPSPADPAHDAAADDAAMLLAGAPPQAAAAPAAPEKPAPAANRNAFQAATLHTIPQADGKA